MPLERGSNLRVERVGQLERCGPRSGGASGAAGARQPVEELARAHRVHSAALRDVPQHGVVRDHRDLAVVLAAVGQPLDHRVGRLGAGVANRRGADLAVAPVPVEHQHRLGSRPRRVVDHAATSSARTRTYSLAAAADVRDVVAVEDAQPSAPQPSRRCLRASNSSTAAAVHTFSDSTRPRIGIDTAASHEARTRGRSPRPSAPSTNTAPSR